MEFIRGRELHEQPDFMSNLKRKRILFAGHGSRRDNTVNGHDVHSRQNQHGALPLRGHADHRRMRRSA